MDLPNNRGDNVPAWHLIPPSIFQCLEWLCVDESLSKGFYGAYENQSNLHIQQSCTFMYIAALFILPRN